MLNFYYWYSIITSIILGLYLLPFSSLNTKINPYLFILIVLSIVFSIILGKIFNNRFIYKPAIYRKNKFFYLPMVAIVVLYLYEILYLREIPFITVTIKHINKYQEFESIPFLHMFLSMLCMYYSTKYIYHAISYKEKRKTNIVLYFVINIIMLSYNMRSFLMISMFIALNLLVAKVKSSDKKILSQKNGRVIIVVLLLLFMFGGIGNMRQGYAFSDSTYIQQIGRYKKWPNIIPKQFMWPYSYITSPLANLNYNITIQNSTKNIEGFVYQLIPDSISKRIRGVNSVNECELITQVFTTSTGYCRPYSNMGLFGIVLFWIIVMFFPIPLFKYYVDKNKYESFFVFVSLYCTCITFLFFTNMFTYGGTSPALWLSILILVSRIKTTTNKGR